MDIKYTPQEIAQELINSFSQASRNMSCVTLQYDIKCAIVTCNKLRQVTQDPIYDLVLTELSKKFKE